MARFPDARLYPAYRAIAEGASLEEAGALVGVAASTLMRRLREDPGRVHRRLREDALTLEEREEIRLGIDRGERDTEIARRLRRHRGTIGREIKRNGGRAQYRAFAASDRALERRCGPRTPGPRDAPGCGRRSRDCCALRSGRPSRSPSGCARNTADQPEWWVSHEAIYQAVFVQAKGELRKELTACLRFGPGSATTSVASLHGGAQILGMVNVSKRPAEVEDRAIPATGRGT